MPRSLASTVRPSVDAGVRDRGESYFLQGRVHVRGMQGLTFDATVRGSRRYDVSLTLDGTCLIVDCNCPYLDSVGGACKHIWAAILAADEQRAFHVPAGLWLDVGGTESARLDDPGSDYGDDPVFEFADDRLSAPRMTAEGRRAVSERMKQYWAARRKGLAPPPPAPKRPAPPPPWQTFLADVAPPDETLSPHALSAGDLRARPRAVGRSRRSPDRADGARPEEIRRLGEAEDGDR
jgi:hypothetical protein